MFNVGGPELLVILLVALMILGPKELPKAVRSVGNVVAELRRMSSGFQQEIRSALDVPIETDARERAAPLARRPEDADITETVARNLAPVDVDLAAVHHPDGSPVAMPTIEDPGAAGPADTTSSPVDRMPLDAGQIESREDPGERAAG